MKLATVEKKTFLAELQCTLTSSCAKTQIIINRRDQNSHRSSNLECHGGGKS